MKHSCLHRLLVGLVALWQPARAQNVGIGTTAPNAALDIVSSSKGVLLPRINSTRAT